jgi:hypothetical protein
MPNLPQMAQQVMQNPELLQSMPIELQMPLMNYFRVVKGLGQQ